MVVEACLVKAAVVGEVWLVVVGVLLGESI